MYNNNEPPQLDKNKKMTEKQIVWYILLTEVKMIVTLQSVTSLSVAPLAVLLNSSVKGWGDVDSVKPIRGQHF